jgi:hypothetical protein
VEQGGDAERRIDVSEFRTQSHGTRPTMSTIPVLLILQFLVVLIMKWMWGGAFDAVPGRRHAPDRFLAHTVFCFCMAASLSVVILGLVLTDNVLVILLFAVLTWAWAVPSAPPPVRREAPRPPMRREAG